MNGLNGLTNHFTWPHIIQTAIILVPVIGLYVALRTDLNDAAKDIAQHKTDIAEIRREEKTLATLRMEVAQALADNLRQEIALAEIRATAKSDAATTQGLFKETKDILTQVQISLGITAGTGKKR